MLKLNFQQLLLQTSVSHDPSEIIPIFLFSAQETFLIINVKNSVQLYIFVKIMMYSLLKERTAFT